MKRRSPLDSLRVVRERTRDARLSTLSQHVADEERAREHLARCNEELRCVEHAAHQLRQQQQSRLDDAGISAAEGRQAEQWLVSVRDKRRSLQLRLQEAKHRVAQAQARTNPARTAVQQAAAQLEPVHRLLGKRSNQQRARQEGEE